MSEKKKAEEGFLYNANYNAALLDERAWCKDQCHLCNQLRPSDTEKRYQIYHSLFKQMGKHVSIEPPFWCDYGYHISIGNEFFMNHNGVILDGAEVTFGDYVYIAPNCGFYTAGHPLDVEQRKQGLEKQCMDRSRRSGAGGRYHWGRLGDWGRQCCEQRHS